MRKSTTYRKLIEIAEFLEDFYKRRPGTGLKFDYEVFGLHKGAHKPEEKNYCGTTACAIGAAALAGVAGLKATWDNGYLDPKNGSGKWSDYAMEKLGITFEEYMCMFANEPFEEYNMDKNDYVSDPQTVVKGEWDAKPRDVARVVRYIAESRYGTGSKAA